MAKNSQRERRQRGIVIFVAIATTISLAGLTGLFVVTPTPADPNAELTDSQIAQIVSATGIPCKNVGNGFQSGTAQEIHTHLSALLDGEAQTIPAKIGVYNGCIQEINTTDTSGIINVSISEGKAYTFQDLINVWGLNLDQFELQGLSFKVIVNGKPNDNDTGFALEDGQEIVLELTSIPFPEDSADSEPEAS